MPFSKNRNIEKVDMPKISRYLAAQLSRNNTVAHGGVSCHTYKSGESFLSLRKLTISRNSAAMGRESLQSQFATSCSMLICERSAKKIQQLPNDVQRHKTTACGHRIHKRYVSMSSAIRACHPSKTIFLPTTDNFLKPI